MASFALRSSAATSPRPGISSEQSRFASYGAQDTRARAPMIGSGRWRTLLTRIARVAFSPMEWERVSHDRRRGLMNRCVQVLLRVVDRNGNGVAIQPKNAEQLTS